MSVAHDIMGKLRTGDVLISENVDFSGLLLSDYVIKGLTNSGFQRPSPIQLKAIPMGRCGLDLIVQAKSGTGKTGVFTVVALESLQLDSSAVQVLVLAPTREIAIQIWDVIRSIGSSMPSLRCHTFIGGMPLPEDIQKLHLCHIAVGTPGRIKHLIENGILKIDSIRLFVLDEADKLLEESFQDQINWIYSSLPENKQMLALSATYPEYLAKHLTVYMRNPTFLRLNVTDPALLGIKQYVESVPYHPLPNKAFDEKIKVVTKLLSSVDFHQCLIFSNLQTRAENLAGALISQGWPTACIAGSYEQKERNDAMAKLKTYKCRVLISTDLTSRGIDAERVNLVINLDVPKNHETYLHRIGRAGRFGTFGASVTIVSEGQEQLDLQSLETKCNTDIRQLPEPLPADLCKSTAPIHLKDMVSAEKITSTPILKNCNKNNSEVGNQMAIEKQHTKCKGVNPATLNPQKKVIISPGDLEQMGKSDSNEENSCSNRNDREIIEKTELCNKPDDKSNGKAHSDDRGKYNSNEKESNKNSQVRNKHAAPESDVHITEVCGEGNELDTALKLEGKQVLFMESGHDKNMLINSTEPCVIDFEVGETLSKSVISDDSERKVTENPNEYEEFKKSTTTDKTVTSPSGMKMVIPSFSETIHYHGLLSLHTHDTLTKDYEAYLETDEEASEIQFNIPAIPDRFPEERRVLAQQIANLLNNIHEGRAQDREKMTHASGKSETLNIVDNQELLGVEISHTNNDDIRQLLYSAERRKIQNVQISESNRMQGSEIQKHEPKFTGKKMGEIKKTAQNAESKENKRTDSLQTGVDHNDKEKIVSDCKVETNRAFIDKKIVSNDTDSKLTTNNWDKTCDGIYKQKIKVSSKAYSENSTVPSSSKQLEKQFIKGAVFKRTLCDERKNDSFEHLSPEKYQQCREYVYSQMMDFPSKNGQDCGVPNDQSQTNPYPYGNPMVFQQNVPSYDYRSNSYAHENNGEFNDRFTESSWMGYVNYGQWNIPANPYYINPVSTCSHYVDYRQTGEFGFPQWNYPAHYYNTQAAIQLSEHTKMYQKMKIMFDIRCQYIKMMLN